MKHAFVRLTGLLIVLMLVLTGCNLIGTDQMVVLDQNFAKLNQRYSGVVATYDGGEVTQADVMANFSYMYSNYSQMYSMFGMSVPAEVVTEVEQSVAESAIEDIAIARQMEARGLKLDDERLAEIQAEADEHYDELYEMFSSSISEKDEAIKARTIEYNLAANGFTRESLYNIELASANRELVMEDVRAEVEDVSGDELQEAYEAKLASDEEQYSADRDSFEQAMTSEDEVVCWIPEGYRIVKHILVIPEGEAMTAYSDARDAYDEAQENLEMLREELASVTEDAADEGDVEAEGDEVEVEAEEEADEEVEEAEFDEPVRTADEIQADIDAAEAALEPLKADMDKAAEACLASVQDKLDEIYGKIEAGEDFEALIEAYGEDPGMQNEPTKTRGYYVCAESTTWDSSFTAGAMALENVGDITQTPVVSSSGVHIIRYESDVTPGAIALEEIEEALHDETLESKKAAHYTSELEAWVAALNPQYDMTAYHFGEE